MTERIIIVRNDCAAQWKITVKDGQKLKRKCIENALVGA